MTGEIEPKDTTQAAPADNVKPVFVAERNRGKFTKLPPALEKYKITKETSAELARRRHEKYRQAAAAAVAERVGQRVSQVSTPVQAWSYIVADQVGKILDNDKPRGDDVRQVGQWIGAVVSESDRTLPGENSEGGGGWGPQMIAMLAELARTTALQAEINAAQAAAAAGASQAGGGRVHLYEQDNPVIDGTLSETNISGSNNVGTDSSTSTGTAAAGAGSAAAAVPGTGSAA